MRAPSPAAPLLEYLMRPLAPWLEDPATEDIAVNRPGEAWVYQHGAWDWHPVALDYKDLESIAILAGALRQQDVGPASPLLDEKLPNGERLCVCLPPAVPHGTISRTLRKHQDTVIPLSEVNERYRTEHWAEWRSERTVRNLDRPMAAYAAGDFETFLRVAVEEHLNILFAGPTGVGKTTLGKSVIDAIDRSERVITIEDTEELGGCRQTMSASFTPSTMPGSATRSCCRRPCGCGQADNPRRAARRCGDDLGQIHLHRSPRCGDDDPRQQRRRGVPAPLPACQIDAGRGRDR